MKSTPERLPRLGDRSTQSLKGPLGETQALAPDTPPDAPEKAVSFRLPGYDVLQCLGHGVLGELWQVRSPDGESWLARLLHNQGADGEVVHEFCRQLQQVEHPSLPRFVIAGSEDRLVLLLPHDHPTLLDCFQDHVNEGKPGIPRAELLDYLGDAAFALDEIAAEYHVVHQGLCPLSFLVDNGKITFTDFGLMPFYWLALGGSPADWHGRYSAPEVLEGKPAPTSDQYSLALIYAEMISGYHPRPQRMSVQQRSAGKADLTFLSSRDQRAVQKALAADPSRRFKNCQEFLKALGHRPKKRRRNQAAVQWPAIGRRGQLRDQTPLQEATLPQLRSYLQDYMFRTTRLRALHATPSCQYVEFAGDVLHCQAPIRMPEKMLVDSLHAFCREWNAEMVETPAPAKNAGEANACGYRFTVKKPGKMWDRVLGSLPSLEVQLEVQRSAQVASLLVGASITVRPPGRSHPASAEYVHRAGPDVIESLCAILQVQPEQRRHIRLPISETALLVPILPEDGLGDALEAAAKDISLGGIRVETTQPLDCGFAYLILDPAPGPDSIALLIRIVRVEPAEHGYSIGGAFVESPVALGDSGTNLTAHSPPKSVAEIIQ
jgi:hypothetical protein